jgi:hypothetical protein
MILYCYISIDKNNDLLYNNLCKLDNNFKNIIFNLKDHHNHKWYDYHYIVKKSDLIICNIDTNYYKYDFNNIMREAKNIDIILLLNKENKLELSNNYKTIYYEYNNNDYNKIINEIKNKHNKIKIKKIFKIFLFIIILFLLLFIIVYLY